MSLALGNQDEPRCLVDRSVLNEDTVVELDNMGLSIFAPLCGRNRGAFVLDPPDGNTYGCIAFPPKLKQLAGVKADANITDSNSIGEKLLDGNITAKDAVNMIDLIVQSVYKSTPDVDKNPYGCDLGGLAVLECNYEKPAVVKDGPIRAVTLAGVFVPASWATGGKTLTLQQAEKFYGAKDFEEMKTLGLNAVQIPVPLDAFAADAQGDASIKDALKDMLKLIDDAGLKAIITLVGSLPDTDAVQAAALFGENHSAVLAVTLPSKAEDVVAVARTAAPNLTLFVPANGGDLQTLQASDDNIFAALDMAHSKNVGDVASSTSQDDRMKLFYHEAVSCVARSPIEYAACFRNVPVFVSTGFDLSIDDCVNKDTDEFKNYGQCDRFNETIDSGWWERHRTSFASRQMFSYEQGLGWSFATWKLYDEDDGDKNGGIIDSPAKLLSLSDVVAAGLMPSLTKPESAQLACLNPPQPDFLLGDATESPTPAPPPDCGNGWWNFNTSKCDYWIPPTPAPTVPCPTGGASGKVVALSALSGAAVALIASAIILKIRGRKEGYTPLPN